MASQNPILKIKGIIFVLTLLVVAIGFLFKNFYTTEAIKELIAIDSSFSLHYPGEWSSNYDEEKQSYLIIPNKNEEDAYGIFVIEVFATPYNSGYSIDEELEKHDYPSPKKIKVGEQEAIYFFSEMRVDIEDIKTAGMNGYSYVLIGKRHKIIATYYTFKESEDQVEMSDELQQCKKVLETIQVN